MKIFFRWKVLKVGEQDLFRGECVYLVSALAASSGGGGGAPRQLVRERRCQASPLPALPALTALQCNHRSWADFMVDQYATEGRSAFMSRCAPLARLPEPPALGGLGKNTPIGKDSPRRARTSTRAGGRCSLCSPPL